MPAPRLQTSRVEPLRLPGARARTRPNGLAKSARSSEAVYFAGPENRLVAATIERLIKAATEAGRDQLARLPVTLIGPPGCGKSLLTSGVESAWTTAHGPEAVLSTTALDLRRQLERALGSEQRVPGSVERLATRLQAAQLLVIENLEGLADSSATIDLLTTTTDALEESGGRLLVTAGKPLGEIEGLNPRLVGRLVSGLTLQVAAPAEAARQELLCAALSTRGGAIETPAAEELSHWLPADARRVLATADQLYERFGSGRVIGRAEAKRFVTDASRNQTTTSLADLATTVCRYYRMSLKTLRSSSRKAPVVLARAVTIYLARQLTPLSYEEIGRYLGGRDHTTVMHNHRRIEKGLPRDRALRSAMDDLFRKLGRADLISASEREAPEETP